MDSKLFEKMISKGFEEAKETEERLKQRKKEFEENSRRIREEIERKRNRFPKD